MAGITSADFSKQDLAELPLGRIRVDTNWLILSNNRLRALPKEICFLRRLSRLALNDNRIETIDAAIAACQGITWIDLTRNRLRTLPAELGLLTRITGLGLSENEFEEIPACVFRLRNLRKFGFFSNRLARIPPDIRHLQGLVKVDLSNNRIAELPDEFCELRHISWLNLSNNHLRRLPAVISRLTCLEELGLGTNELTELPDMSALARLRILPVFKNRLARVHASLFRLPAIEKLDFSDNALTEFPVTALYAPALRYLNLRNNQIAAIPATALPEGVASSITMLDISENCLRFLPYKLFKAFGETTTIRLGANPYERVPDAVPPAPSLLQMCYTRLLSRRAKAAPWIDNIFQHRHVCDCCRAPFVVDPVYVYCHSYLDSDHHFVIEKMLCSARCRRRCA